MYNISCINYIFLLFNDLLYHIYYIINFMDYCKIHNDEYYFMCITEYDLIYSKIIYRYNS